MIPLAFDPTRDDGADAAADAAWDYAEDCDELRERLRDGLHIALEAALKLRAFDAALPETPRGRPLDDWNALVAVLDDWLSQDWSQCKTQDFHRHFEGDV